MKMSERVEEFLQELVDEGKYENLESALAHFYNLTDKIKIYYKAEKIRAKQANEKLKEACEGEEIWDLGEYSYFPNLGVYYTNKKDE